MPCVLLQIVSPQPLSESKFTIPKSRFDTIDSFLANEDYNDREVVYDPQVFQQLKEGGGWAYLFHYVCVLTVVAGVDDLLAQHIAHLFIRDPISLFAEKLEQNVETETDHFEVR